MNLFSHYRAARFFSKYLCDDLGVNIGKIRFVFGNLKPDICGELIVTPHITSVIFTDKLNDLSEYITALTDCKGKKMPGNIAMGEFCHYIADFFCIAHNNYFKTKREHFVYEWRLNRKWKKLDADFDSLPVAKTITELIDCVKKTHAEYLKGSQSMDKDIEFVIVMCKYVLNSILSICSQATSIPAAA